MYLVIEATDEKINAKRGGVERYSTSRSLGMTSTQPRALAPFTRITVKLYVPMNRMTSTRHINGLQSQRITIPWLVLPKAMFSTSFLNLNFALRTQFFHLRVATRGGATVSRQCNTTTHQQPIFCSWHHSQPCTAVFENKVCTRLYTKNTTASHPCTSATTATSQLAGTAATK